MEAFNTYGPILFVIALVVTGLWLLLRDSWPTVHVCRRCRKEMACNQRTHEGCLRLCGACTIEDMDALSDQPGRS